MSLWNYNFLRDPDLDYTAKDRPSFIHVFFRWGRGKHRDEFSERISIFPVEFLPVYRGDKSRGFEVVVGEGVPAADRKYPGHQWYGRLFFSFQPKEGVKEGVKSMLGFWLSAKAKHRLDPFLESIKRPFGLTIERDLYFVVGSKKSNLFNVSINKTFSQICGNISVHHTYRAYLST